MVRKKSSFNRRCFRTRNQVRPDDGVQSSIRLDLERKKSKVIVAADRMYRRPFAVLSVERHSNFRSVLLVFVFTVLERLEFWSVATAVRVYRIFVRKNMIHNRRDGL